MLIRGVDYQEIRCQSALNRVRGMGFRWSLNPYRGCTHGCHYCFARRYHHFYDLDADQSFTSVIFAKVNVAQVLRDELFRRGWQREPVAVGTATDPYQPIEGRYRLTRSCLEVFCQRHSPVSVVTKGTMIVRDVDILAELVRRTRCTVCFSVTTLDYDLWRRLEPGTPPPQKRLLAMERLVEAGVHAGVLLAPVIPGITDTWSNLTAVVEQAAAHGACFLGADLLRLQEGTREHFLGFLGQEFPELLPLYRRLYPGAYAIAQAQQRVHLRVQELVDLYRIGERTLLPQEEETRPRQLSLLQEAVEKRMLVCGCPDTCRCALCAPS